VIDSHIGSAVQHGVTGNVMGLNMTNTLGASGIVDAHATPGIICIAGRGNGSTDTPSGLRNGEICIWWGASGVFLAVNDNTTYKKVLLS
jgi:hypothetical protein